MVRATRRTTLSEKHPGPGAPPGAPAAGDVSFSPTPPPPPSRVRAPCAIAMAGAAAAGRAAAALPLRVVRAAGATVLAQLRLEETLLRHGAGSWLVVNDGVGGAGGAGGGAGERDWTEPRPVAVLGVSGRVQELLDVQRCVDAGVGAVRRFTGGGTIVADENTIMVSAVVAGGVKDALVQPYPDPIMRFMGGVYGE